MGHVETISYQSLCAHTIYQEKSYSVKDQCTIIIGHCVTTEKVPAKYRSLKMADASLGKCSIFVEWGGIAWTRQRLSVHMGRKSA